MPRGKTRSVVGKKHTVTKGLTCTGVSMNQAATLVSMNFQVKKDAAWRRVDGASDILLKPPKGGGERYLDIKSTEPGREEIYVCTDKRHAKEMTAATTSTKKRKGKVTTWHPMTWWKSLKFEEKFQWGAVGAAVLGIAIWWSVSRRSA